MPAVRRRTTSCVGDERQVGIEQVRIDEGTRIGELPKKVDGASGRQEGLSCGVCQCAWDSPTPPAATPETGDLTAYVSLTAGTGTQDARTDCTWQMILAIAATDEGTEISIGACAKR